MFFRRSPGGINLGVGEVGSAFDEDYFGARVEADGSAGLGHLACIVGLVGHGSNLGVHLNEALEIRGGYRYYSRTAFVLLLWCGC